MEATILRDPKDVNGDLRESRKDGGKIDEEKTVAEKARSGKTALGSPKIASNKCASYDAT